MLRYIINHKSENVHDPPNHPSEQDVLKDGFDEHITAEGRERRRGDGKARERNKTNCPIQSGFTNVLCICLSQKEGQAERRGERSCRDGIPFERRIDTNKVLDRVLKRVFGVNTTLTLTNTRSE